MEPLLKPLLVPLEGERLVAPLILFSILTEEGQPLLTEEAALIQMEPN